EHAGQAPRLHGPVEAVHRAQLLLDQLVGTRTLVLGVDLVEDRTRELLVDALLAQLVREGAASQPPTGLLGPHEALGIGLVVDEADLLVAVEHLDRYVVRTALAAQRLLQLGARLRRPGEQPQHDGAGDRVRVRVLVRGLRVGWRLPARRGLRTLLSDRALSSLDQIGRAHV